MNLKKNIQIGRLTEMMQRGATMTNIPRDIESLLQYFETARSSAQGKTAPTIISPHGELPITEHAKQLALATHALFAKVQSKEASPSEGVSAYHALAVLHRMKRDHNIVYYDSTTELKILKPFMKFVRAVRSALWGTGFVDLEGVPLPKHEEVFKLTRSVAAEKPHGIMSRAEDPETAQCQEFFRDIEQQQAKMHEGPAYHQEQMEYGCEHFGYAGEVTTQPTRDPRDIAISIGKPPQQIFLSKEHTKPYFELSFGHGAVERYPSFHMVQQRLANASVVFIDASGMQRVQRFAVNLEAAYFEKAFCRFATATQKEVEELFQGHAPSQGTVYCKPWKSDKTANPNYYFTVCTADSTRTIGPLTYCPITHEQMEEFLGFPEFTKLEVLGLPF
jgi:hypothetical protein